MSVNICQPHVAGTGLLCFGAYGAMWVNHPGSHSIDSVDLDSFSQSMSLSGMGFVHHSKAGGSIHQRPKTNSGKSMNDGSNDWLLLAEYEGNIGLYMTDEPGQPCIKYGIFRTGAKTAMATWIQGVLIRESYWPYSGTRLTTTRTVADGHVKVTVERSNDNDQQPPELRQTQNYSFTHKSDGFWYLVMNETYIDVYGKVQHNTTENRCSTLNLKLKKSYVYYPTLNSALNLGAVVGKAYACCNPRDEIHTEHCVKLINSIPALDINGIAFLSDIKNITATIKSAKNLLKGRVDLKNVSGAYLMKKYALDTTIRDVQTISSRMPEIRDELRKIYNRYEYTERRFHERTSESRDYTNRFSHFSWILGNTRVRSFVTCVTTAYIAADNKGPIGNLISTLDGLDVLPTPQNLWDLVPYSFVVDWFFDLGSNFDTMDYNRRREDYHIIKMCYSEKQIINLNLVGDYTGWVTVSNYIRFPKECWPQKHFELNLSLPTSHFVEMGALAVQSKR